LRTRTKICGITRLEDAKASILAGCDALGFVFYKESPRYIALDAFKVIARELPPFVTKVGLFVNIFMMQKLYYLMRLMSTLRAAQAKHLIGI